MWSVLGRSIGCKNLNSKLWSLRCHDLRIAWRCLPRLCLHYTDTTLLESSLSGKTAFSPNIGCSLKESQGSYLGRRDDQIKPTVLWAEWFVPLGQSGKEHDTRSSPSQMRDRESPEEIYRMPMFFLTFILTLTFWLIFGKLWEARSRLYRNRILQVNTNKI